MSQQHILLSLSKYSNVEYNVVPIFIIVQLFQTKKLSDLSIYCHLAQLLFSSWSARPRLCPWVTVHTALHSTTYSTHTVSPTYIQYTTLTQYYIQYCTHTVLHADTVHLQSNLHSTTYSIHTHCTVQYYIQYTMCMMHCTTNNTQCTVLYTTIHHVLYYTLQYTVLQYTQQYTMYTVQYYTQQYTLHSTVTVLCSVQLLYCAVLL